MENTEATLFGIDDSEPLGGPYFTASIVENYFHACVGTILTGLHLLTLCTCTTEWYPHLQVFIIKDPTVLKAIGGTGNLTSESRVERNIRYNFPHPYCGGNLSRVDLSVLQLWIPWPLTRNFVIAPLHLDMNTTYFDYLYETKHLETPICRTGGWWEYNMVQAPSAYSPLVRETRELKYFLSKVVAIRNCYPFKVGVQNDTHVVTNIRQPFEKSKLCAMTQKPPWTYCGIDKGAPLTCYQGKALGWRLYGIGLGGINCVDFQSLGLFQGFTDALSFLRLYLGMDLTLREYTHINLKSYMNRGELRRPELPPP